MSANFAFSASNFCCGLGLPPNIKTVLQFSTFTALPLVFMMFGKMSFPYAWKLMTRRSKHLPTPTRISYRPKLFGPETNSPEMMDFMQMIINRNFAFLLCIIIGTIFLTTIVSYKKLKEQRRAYRQRARVDKVAARMLSFHKKANPFVSTRKNLTYEMITSQLSKVLTKKSKNRSKSFV